MSGEVRGFKRYPSYKDSGVEWIGAIPAHWHSRRIKYVAPPVDQRSGVADRAVRYIGLENVESGTGRLLDASLHATSEDAGETAASLFEPDDVLFGKLRPYLAKVVRVDFPGRCSTELLVLRSRGEVIPKLLAYQLLSAGFISWIDAMTYGTKMPRANPSQVLGVPIPVASPLEQRAIVRFLDRETARVDALVGKKHGLIELLKEKGRELITRAVTKGLDLRVPMKDCEASWLGDMPANWGIWRLKYSLRSAIKNGLFKKKEMFGSGTPLINVFDIYRDDFVVDPGGLERVQTDELERQHYSANPGDILFVRSSLKLDGVGRAARVAALREPTVFECHLVRAQPGALVDSEYLAYTLNSTLVRQRLVSLANTVTMSTLSQTSVGELEIALPSRDEQALIVAYLHAEQQKLRGLVREIQAGIEALLELRTALIAAAVTGKIDVREEVA